VLAVVATVLNQPQTHRQLREQQTQVAVVVVAKVMAYGLAVRVVQVS
jgi:hypothetical protein